MNKKNLSNPAVLALVILALIWGYNWVVMKKVLEYCGPFDFAALRTFFGALFLFAALVWMKKPLRPTALKTTLLLGLLQTSIFTALVMWALVAGGAGKTAVHPRHAMARGGDGACWFVFYPPAVARPNSKSATKS